MKLLVILTTCTVCLDIIMAKSNSAINQDIKVKTSSKINSLPTTPKPDNQYLALQQQQQQQQQYRQQNYPQQPAAPQYQIQAQPQRQIHGQQQIFVQPTQVYQSQTPQLQQSQLQQVYQSQLQAQPQPQLQQVFQRAYIVPQQQNRPAAMILIAHPGYVPQNVLFTGATNQVGNYLHGNPQARYQLLQGQAQQIAQPTPAHTIGNYQVVAVPAQYHQQNIVAVPQAAHLPQPLPVPVPQQEATPQPTPLQLAQIAHIASQQYSRIIPSPSQQQVASSQPYSYQTEPRALQENLQGGGPVRSIPPIITGFENFSPEQQEKIKVQLSAYFGAPLRPLPNGALPVNSIQESEGQGKGRAQYGQAEESRLGGNEFVPSPSEQAKGDASASSSNVFKSHYARV